MNTDLSEFEEITDEALRRLRVALHGVQGHTIRPTKSLEYWVYVVTKERMSPNTKSDT